MSMMNSCKLYLKSFGCKTNISECNEIYSKLAGYADFVRDIKDANLIIVNTCCVTDVAVKKCLYFIKSIKHKNTYVKLVVTGCLANYMGEQLKKYNVDVIILNEYKKSLIPILRDSKLVSDKCVANDNTHYGNTRAFLKIQEGCNNYCSYCIIPMVRGAPQNKPLNIILGEFNKLLEKNYKEIVLVGTNIGTYKTEEGIDLTGLLQRLMAIKKNFRIRLSSIEINEINEELIELFKNYNNKICAHLHIPLQSGSDKILSLMNRHYTTSDFIDRLSYIRSILSNATIGFDVIVGFPSEGTNDFLQTKDFIINTKPNYVHIFPYSDREGTKAYNMNDKISDIEKEKRAKELKIIDRLLRINSYKNKINTFCRVLIEKDNTGYTDDYFRVKVDMGKINEFINVKIEGFNEEHLQLTGKMVK